MKLTAEEQIKLDGLTEVYKALSIVQSTSYFVEDRFSALFRETIFIKAPNQDLFQLFKLRDNLENIVTESDQETITETLSHYKIEEIGEMYEDSVKLALNGRLVEILSHFGMGGSDYHSDKAYLLEFNHAMKNLITKHEKTGK